jgi:hypothetical protein
MARSKYWPDSVLLDCLLRVAARGAPIVCCSAAMLPGVRHSARMVAYREWCTCPSVSFLV